MGYYIIGIIAFVVSLGIQQWLRSTYGTWSQRANGAGLTGAEAARAILASNGITDVEVTSTKGTLSDHYDPSNKVVRLSEENYRQASVAAMAVAAHEVGHAIQHNKGYAPLQVRSAIAPAAQLGSRFGPILAVFGLFLGATGLLNIGILLFSAAVLFHVVTLPVEFDASSRALGQLEQLGITTDTDRGGARSVLNAAAMTYVAATATAVAYLLYFVMASRD